MVLFTVDRSSSTPLFRQIVERVVSMVNTEALLPGQRLPSSRTLAERLSVNRSTVARAYEELWALGYLESRSGSYSTIRRRTDLASAGEASGKEGLDWDQLANPRCEALIRDYELYRQSRARGARQGVVDLSRLAPDDRLLPRDEFRKCVNRAMRNGPRELLQYGDPRGYGPLREFIAQHMRHHSVSVRADEILITNGSQNAVELIFKLLTEPRKGVAIETPTYSAIIPLLRYYDVAVVEVPMLDDGMNLSCLEKALEKSRVGLVYTIPNFHNPTGVTTSQSHRERLLALCEDHGVPIVEDGFEEEMKYFGKSVLPIKSMDAHDVVIYVGTFSKILFPGLRVGWVAAAEKCVERLAAVKRSSDLGGNHLMQAALNQFCRMGSYELHIKRIHRAYRKRMQAAFKALDDHLPRGGVTWTRPLGGYTIWVRVDVPSMDEERLIEHIADHGVAVSPGRVHYTSSPDGLYLRISISQSDEEEIEAGVARLGRALQKALLRNAKKRGKR